MHQYIHITDKHMYTHENTITNLKAKKRQKNKEGNLTKLLVSEVFPKLFSDYLTLKAFILFSAAY